MSRGFQIVEKVIYSGCGVDTLCEGTCRKLHKDNCPAFYRFIFEKEEISRRMEKKKVVLRKRELR